MDFNVENALDSVKEKAVKDATEKFGPRATPVAEKVADKTEEEIASKLGVPLHNQQNNPNPQPRQDEQNKANQQQPQPAPAKPATQLDTAEPNAAITMWAKPPCGRVAQLDRAPAF